jgi:hypothetical protein
MRSFKLGIFALCASVAVATPFAALSNKADPLKDGCPKDEIACLDVMNSSQCIEQLIIEKQAPVTKEALVKCIETEGSASMLPGAARVSSNSNTHRVARQNMALMISEKTFG